MLYNKLERSPKLLKLDLTLHVTDVPLGPSYIPQEKRWRSVHSTPCDRPSTCPQWWTHLPPDGGNLVPVPGEEVPDGSQFLRAVLDVPYLIVKVSRGRTSFITASTDVHTLHTHTQICTTCTQTDRHTHAHTCTCTHACTHTHTYACTHTHTQCFKSPCQVVQIDDLAI